MSRIEPGTLLGRVRLESVLGRGSTATVYKGHHVHLGVEVAVKVMEPRLGRNVEDRNRFLREARIAARLEDPAVVRVHDFGEYGDSCYLVMDLVKGATLEQYLEQQRGPTAEATVIKLLRRVARALRAAHAAGLVHRDLKPANILISHEGQLKVTDFGLAQASGGPSTDRDGMFNGTPAYVAPECVTLGARVDRRADLYSLGIIGYELVFGTLPYRGSVEDMLAGHLGGRARFDLSTHCSPRLVSLIRRLMVTHAEKRIQSAEQLLQSLEALRRSRGPTVTTTRRTGRAGHDSEGSEDFSSLVRFLEDRFGGRTSDHFEGRVVHSTTRERAMVWVLLAATIGVAVLGYLVHGG